MPKLATWLRAKDEKWFQPFFDRHPEIEIRDARKGDVSIASVNGLLLTGGADIAPEFLKQPVSDPSVLDKDIDVARDRWEFAAVDEALQRGLPILAICKGMQLLNVALGGTLTELFSTIAAMSFSESPALLSLMAASGSTA